MKDINNRYAQDFIDHVFHQTRNLTEEQIKIVVRFEATPYT